MLNVQLNVSYN